MTLVTKILFIVTAMSLLSPVATSGQVKLPLRIGPGSTLSPQLTELLKPGDEFGASVAALGDLDSDGWLDLAVGAPGTDGEGANRGCVYILFLDGDAAVNRIAKIDDPNPAFEPRARYEDRFGEAIAYLGDIDSDGTTEIAVGAPGYDFDRGAVWILSLKPEGELDKTQQVSAAEIGLTLEESDQFGKSVAAAGDLDGDGEADLVVGVPGDGPGGVWTVLRLSGSRRFVWSPPAFVDHSVPPDALFGISVTAGDIDGNGTMELLVGASQDEVDNETVGSVTVGELGLGGDLGSQRLVFHGTEPRARTGLAVATLGDLERNGFLDLAIGSPGYRGRRGEASIIYLGTGLQKIVDRSVVQSSSLDLNEFDRFGSSLVGIPDVDGDSGRDLVVGSPGSGLGRGSIWVVSIPAAPVPSIESVSVSPGEPPSTTESIKIVATALDPQKTALTLRAFLRRGGDADFFSVAMVPTNHSLFEVTIPDGIVDSRGVEYFVEARNSLGFASKFPVTGYISLPLRIANGVSTVVTQGDASTAYRLISFPLDLERSSARELFRSQLGSYDPKRWRFFELTRSNPYELFELSDGDIEIRQGEAYWLIVKNRDRTITTGPGFTARTDTVFAVPLRAGYNLVGNPFDFLIPLEAIGTTRGRGVDVWAYRGGWQTETVGLRPFEGYAIRLRDTLVADTLLIDPNAARVPAGSVLGSRDTETDVRFRMAVRAFKGRSSDVENYVILSDNAEDEWDDRDRYEPPPIGDYVLAGFERKRTDNTAAVELLSTDARPSTTDSTAWNLIVSAATDGVVDLHFEVMGRESGKRSVWLIDEVAKIIQDVSRSARYRVSVNGPALTRRLRLVYVSDGSVPPSMQHVPSVTERIIDVFPNPFRAAATIRYSIAEQGHVVLSLYDTLGRRVTVILDVPDHLSGTHAAVWDGKSTRGARLASGLYVLRLSVDGQPFSSRLVTLIR